MHTNIHAHTHVRTRFQIRHIARPRYKIFVRAYANNIYTRWHNQNDCDDDDGLDWMGVQQWNPFNSGNLKWTELNEMTDWLNERMN